MPAQTKESVIPTTARTVVAPSDSRMLRIESVTLPDPGPHQVLVRQYATGVCHTQLHMIREHRTQPILLGHESTGRVMSVGSDVGHVQSGDEVILTWVPRGGTPSRAPEPVEVSLPDGSTIVTRSLFTWSDHTLVDESFVVPLPQGVPTDVTSIVGCAVMTGVSAVIRYADVRPGQSVAVFGVGGIGLSAVAAAAIVGAYPLIAVDLDPVKLDKARAFGASHVINAGDDGNAGPVAAIHALTSEGTPPAAWGRPGSGVDVAFDCIGVKRSMEQAFGCVRYAGYGDRRGGTAVLVGVPRDTIELNTADVLAGKSFTGTLGGACIPDRDFPLYLRWYEQGRLDLDALVTRRYALSDVNEAVLALEAGRIVGRAIIEFPR